VAERSRAVFPPIKTTCVLLPFALYQTKPPFFKFPLSSISCVVVVYGYTIILIYIYMSIYI
jgi:hypothetical protein